MAGASSIGQTAGARELKLMRREHLLVVLSIVIALSGCSRKAATTQEQLDRKFEETMKGVTLVGRSTRLQDDKIIGEEKYVIEGVSKLAGDTWLFRTRLQYGGHDIPLPLPVTIKWAGDTPVITLTDLSIPGMGTYTARVVLYRDQYAGTWSGKKGGGQIFGKIVRNPYARVLGNALFRNRVVKREDVYRRRPKHRCRSPRSRRSRFLLRPKRRRTG